ncbi:MAG: hypothetical protein H6Q38_1574 [Chloroflexi bacterium]|nr:hypothetical protein [Chloroflexota bacterium]
MPILQEIEARVESENLYAVGYLSYEAAPAFDPALVVRPADPVFPLLWFGLYAPPQEQPLPPADQLPKLEWAPTVTRAQYNKAIRAIKSYIARGHTYQVNYTYRQHARFQGEAFGLFTALAQAQPAAYAAYLDMGEYAICSVSPELFFTLQGEHLTCRPMKGTARRGLTLTQDHEAAQALQASQKDRAENVMIVDMVRNDLGKIARTGSVCVPQLFTTERYPTLWQMTSTVMAESQASFSQIIQALFPCASITGAPKPRTMQIIAELENTPRRVYTGSVGYLAPGRQACFNVAIRTVLVDRRLGVAEYGTGGGVVWDSTARGEYDESLLKAKLLGKQPPVFSLLETLLWQPVEGYFLLERHIQRLRNSAEYFDYPLDSERIRQALDHYANNLPATPQRVRLLVDRSGKQTLERTPLDPGSVTQPVRLGIAATPVDPADPFLYHKTTHRVRYNEALAARPGCDDVILWNTRGEITETTIGNLVLRLDGELLTPPVECGLLAGVMRADLLDRGVVQERAIQLEELAHCEEIYVINSVRGWRKGFLYKVVW